MTDTLPTITLPGGETRPALGLGTWRLGERADRRAAEVAVVRRALELGYRVLDTAEMYGEGGAERVVGEAVAAALADGTLTRDQLFVVSKVYPHNASLRGVPRAFEASLRRLGLDYIDLYLLHWRGEHPLAEAVAAFEALKSRGLIRHWGVSNLDVDDLEELSSVPAGTGCAANQVWYSLQERGIERDLLPWQHARGMPLMAYSPIDGGSLPAARSLAPIAARLGVTPAQVALAWVLAQPQVMAIPKTAREDRLRENLAAAALSLDAATLAELDAAFPPPKRKVPLAMR